MPKTHNNTVILMLAPEMGRPPDHMGILSRYVSGKSGGLGEVVAALCAGLNGSRIDRSIGKPLRRYINES